MKEYSKEDYKWDLIAMIAGLLIAMFCFIKMLGV